MQSIIQNFSCKIAWYVQKQWYYFDMEFTSAIGSNFSPNSISGIYWLNFSFLTLFIFLLGHFAGEKPGCPRELTLTGYLWTNVSKLNKVTVPLMIRTLSGQSYDWNRIQSPFSNNVWKFLKMSWIINYFVFSWHERDRWHRCRIKDRHQWSAVSNRTTEGHIPWQEVCRSWQPRCQHQEWATCRNRGRPQACIPATQPWH